MRVLKSFKEFLFSKLVRNTFITFLFLLSTELIVRLITDITVNYGILRIILSSFFISLFINIICSYFNKTVAKIIRIIMSLAISIYVFVETGLFNYLGFYMGIGNSEQGTKTLQYISDFFKSLTLKYYYIFIPFLVVLIYYILIDKRLSRFEKIKNSRRIGIKRIIPTIITLIIMFIVGLGYYFTLVSPSLQNKLQTIKNKSLFLYPENSNLSVSQFGVLMYGLTDINSYIFNIGPVEDVIFDTEKKDEYVEPDFDRKINDEAWNRLIANEKNSTYNQLNKYFINRNITSKNDYTGIFKDKNLIVVMMESVNEISINKEYFPNIYKIYSEGISFKNNYSPRNNCSTGNNEMTVMTSLYSINNTCTANSYKNNEYFQAIFNMFKNAGYSATSYHSYTDHYYSRHTIHPNMGSDKFYNVKDLGMQYNDLVYEEWPSDLAFFETALPKFINQEKFMSFMITVTTHQTYHVPSEFGDKNVDMFSETGYDKTTKRYLSKMVELDKGLGHLLDELERTGKMEDTVIVLFADHYPYGLTKSQINKVLDYDVTKRLEVDRTPMVIYNSEIEPQVVEKYTSIIDLLPTILNMFDVDYDPRLYLGTDIMSENDGRVAFSDGSWQDEVGFYKSTTTKFTTTNDDNKTYTTDELVSINKEISNKQKMSALAIRNNYFKYLNEGLEKYKKEIQEEQTQQLENSQELNDNVNS